jgi:hypothetical protein
MTRGLLYIQHDMPSGFVNLQQGSHRRPCGSRVGLRVVADLHVYNKVRAAGGRNPPKKILKNPLRETRFCIGLLDIVGFFESVIYIYMYNLRIYIYT